MVELKVKKAWYKRWWAIALFIFVGIIILSNLFGSNDTSTVNTQPIQDSKTENEKEEVKTFQLGDEIQAGDFKWKITKVTTAQQIGEDVFGTFLGEKADGIFVIIDVEVENTGKSAKYLSDSFVKLIDNQDREFSTSTTAAFYLKPEGSALAFEQINPGIVKRGKLVYDVPEGITFVNMKISSNLLSSSVYDVKLVI